jgi:hypothetical protein
VRGAFGGGGIVYGHCNGSDSDVSDEVHDGDGAGRDDDHSPSQSQGLASEQGSTQQSQAASSPTRSHAFSQEQGGGPAAAAADQDEFRHDAHERGTRLQVGAGGTSASSSPLRKGVRTRGRALDEGGTQPPPHQDARASKHGSDRLGELWPDVLDELLSDRAWGLQEAHVRALAVGGKLQGVLASNVKAAMAPVATAIYTAMNDVFTGTVMPDSTFIRVVRGTAFRGIFDVVAAAPGCSELAECDALGTESEWKISQSDQGQLVDGIARPSRVAPDGALNVGAVLRHSRVILESLARPSVARALEASRPRVRGERSVALPLLRKLARAPLRETGHGHVPAQGEVTDPRRSGWFFRGTVLSRAAERAKGTQDWLRHVPTEFEGICTPSEEATVFEPYAIMTDACLVGKSMQLGDSMHCATACTLLHTSDHADSRWACLLIALLPCNDTNDDLHAHDGGINRQKISLYNRAVGMGDRLADEGSGEIDAAARVGERFDVLVPATQDGGFYQPETTKSCSCEFIVADGKGLTERMVRQAHGDTEHPYVQTTLQKHQVQAMAVSVVELPDGTQARRAHFVLAAPLAINSAFMAAALNTGALKDAQWRRQTGFRPKGIPVDAWHDGERWHCPGVDRLVWDPGHVIALRIYNWFGASMGRVIVSAYGIGRLNRWNTIINTRYKVGSYFKVQHSSNTGLPFVMWRTYRAGRGPAVLEDLPLPFGEKGEVLEGRLYDVAMAILRLLRDNSRMALSADRAEHEKLRWLTLPRTITLRIMLSLLLREHAVTPSLEWVLTAVPPLLQRCAELGITLSVLSLLKLEENHALRNLLLTVLGRHATAAGNIGYLAGFKRILAKYLMLSQQLDAHADMLARRVHRGVLGQYGSPRWNASLKFLRMAKRLLEKAAPPASEDGTRATLALAMAGLAQHTAQSINGGSEPPVEEEAGEEAGGDGTNNQGTVRVEEEAGEEVGGEENGSEEEAGGGSEDDDADMGATRFPADGAKLNEMELGELFARALPGFQAMEFPVDAEVPLQDAEMGLAKSRDGETTTALLALGGTGGRLYARLVIVMLREEGTADGDRRQLTVPCRGFSQWQFDSEALTFSASVCSKAPKFASARGITAGAEKKRGGGTLHPVAGSTGAAATGSVLKLVFKAEADFDKLEQTLRAASALLGPDFANREVKRVGSEALAPLQPLGTWDAQKPVADRRARNWSPDTSEGTLQLCCDAYADFQAYEQSGGRKEDMPGSWETRHPYTGERVHVQRTNDAHGIVRLHDESNAPCDEAACFNSDTASGFPVEPLSDVVKTYLCGRAVTVAQGAEKGKGGAVKPKRQRGPAAGGGGAGGRGTRGSGARGSGAGGSGAGGSGMSVEEQQARSWVGRELEAKFSGSAWHPARCVGYAQDGAKEGAWLVNVVYENAQGEGDWIAPAELGDAAGEFRLASRKGGGGAKRKQRGGKQGAPAG